MSLEKAYQDDLSPCLILASASPRRLELLQSVGLDPQVMTADVLEIKSAAAPENIVVANALTKARFFAGKYPQALIIGADTIVVKDGKVYGKPDDAEDAAAMLHALSGAEHTVYSGLALVDSSTYLEEVGWRSTVVQFRELSEEMIAAYIATGEPLDKAGAYGIQGKGAVLIESIQGDFSTVVGLSLPLLSDLLARFQRKIF